MVPIPGLPTILRLMATSPFIRPNLQNLTEGNFWPVWPPLMQLRGTLIQTGMGDSVSIIMLLRADGHSSPPRRT